MINKFINYLKQNRIDFLIINGYEDIEENVERNNDNDLLFRKKTFKNIDNILRDFCKKNKCFIVQKMHHDIYAKNFFLYFLDTKEFLNLDLYGELSREGFVIYEEDEVFNTIRDFKKLPILSVEKDFFTYFIKKNNKKDLEPKSFNFLKKLFLSNRTSCKEAIKKYIKSYSEVIVSSFETDNIELLLNNRKQILDEFLSNKQISLKREVLDGLRVLKRVFFPTGLVVSFLGPDGSGKSTIINTINSSNLPFRRSDYFHLKPKTSKTNNSNICVDDPHKDESYSFFKSYLKLFYFIFQYNYGWFKNILKLKMKSSLIIFDRYYDDLLVDSKRYRYGGSLSFARFIRNFIPKPDLCFILTSDADVIYKRKQEVPFEELKRQIKEYKKLADGKRYFNIDVNRTPEEISNEIIELIARKMSERY